jgi:putative FmdB family regulatory protein
MPIYEYRCVACGREIEVIHGIHADGPSTCDVCGAPMRKLMSAPAIVFRGGGWAKKDARESRSARSADGSAPRAEKSAGETEKSARETEKSAGETEKSPAGEGTSRRDKPAGAAASGGVEKGAPGGGKSSRSSGSDD